MAGTPSIDRRGHLALNGWRDQIRSGERMKLEPVISPVTMTPSTKEEEMTRTNDLDRDQFRLVEPVRRDVKLMSRRARSVLKLLMPCLANCCR